MTHSQRNDDKFSNLREKYFNMDPDLSFIFKSLLKKSKILSIKLFLNSYYFLTISLQWKKILIEIQESKEMTQVYYSL